ncbi:hypothetical protein A1O1_04502 [Capronia coronata CBS 617.96]|uniref:Transcription factor domain-containing protein n=1 Tax=Capronia coronata CBS 617.96 TaxID=1182541 RepID=W9YP17_9EURO|nr:uncharacterized protein A1O1_04502 [Capronia coronata CBS 617.96]EXJ91390.1 hypothetical protein A1O1_04502 [Capronia coronata CBS 617.96]
MATKKQQQRRTFTFVDYDINRRGVTESARAHLMKDRVRSKREARLDWLSRNRASSLRGMRPKKENGGRTPGSVCAAPEQDNVNSGRDPITCYAAVFDFQKDNMESLPLTTNPRSVSPRLNSGIQVDTLQRIGKENDCAEQRLYSRYDGRSVEERGDQINEARSADSPASPQSSPNTPEIECLSTTPDPKRRRDLEFGLPCLNIANTPPVQTNDVHRSSSLPSTPAASHLSPGIDTSADKTTITLEPPERNLIRYFASHACTMLGFDRYPDIVEKHDPVLKLFIPFALCSQWCFETMVLLHSAYHHRGSVVLLDEMVMEAENQYLASRQNAILARTRSRISALAFDGDSSDEDVIAFLFLAVSEYLAGHRQIGVMHFRAWKEYCEMRRRLGVRPCGLPCKTIVWWCVSMLVGDDVILDSILSPSTRAQVRDDPTRLFRYFAHHSKSETAAQTEGPVRAKLSRHGTC